MSARATRRQLFGASAAAVLLGPAIALPENSLDAALLAACAEYHRAHAEWHGPQESDAHGVRLCDARNRALRVVLEMPHSTEEGLVAKAGVAHSALVFEANCELNVNWREDVERETVLAIDVLGGLVRSNAA